MPPRKTPDWVKAIPGNLCNFITEKLLHRGEIFGLFRICENSFVPYDIPSSVRLFGALDSFGKLETAPGYGVPALGKLRDFIQRCQDPETGLFIDPQLDPRFSRKDDAAAYMQFRHAVSKYAIGFLAKLDAEPLHPYSSIGRTGKPDPETYLKHMREGDWNCPWGIGSSSGAQTAELSRLINDGHDEYIPAVREGIEFLLSKQNEGGMWGPASIPLYQQISGALKVVGRLMFQIGMEMPRMDRLADSIIAHQKAGDFYRSLDCDCVPRNAVEMAVACLESSDYRRDELIETLSLLVDEMREYVTPDGGVSPQRASTGAIGWCGATVAPLSEEPRGTGSSAILYGIGLAAAYLGWDDCPLANPLAGWRERVAQFQYVPVITRTGSVDIVRK